jgi:hypothetical protein
MQFVILKKSICISDVGIIPLTVTDDLYPVSRGNFKLLYFSSNRHGSLPCQIFMPPPLTCNFVRCCAFLPSSCKVAEFAPGRIPELWTIQEVWSFLFETKISVVKRNPLIISAGTRHVPKGDQQFPYFLAACSLVPSSRYSFKYTRTKRELYTLKFALRTVD